MKVKKEAKDGEALKRRAAPNVSMDKYKVPPPHPIYPRDPLLNVGARSKSASAPPARAAPRFQAKGLGKGKDYFFKGFPAKGFG